MGGTWHNEFVLVIMLMNGTLGFADSNVICRYGNWVLGFFKINRLRYRFALFVGVNIGFMVFVVVDRFPSG